MPTRIHHYSSHKKCNSNFFNKILHTFPRMVARSYFEMQIKSNYLLRRLLVELYFCVRYFLLKNVRIVFFTRRRDAPHQLAIEKNIAYSLCAIENYHISSMLSFIISHPLHATAVKITVNFYRTGMFTPPFVIPVGHEMCNQKRGRATPKTSSKGRRRRQLSQNFAELEKRETS